MTIGGEGGGGQYDAPNQQVVRPDESAPWDEGSGGSQHPEEKDTNPLDAMTKEELLAYAEEQGLEVSSAMTKAEIRAAIDEAEGR